MALVVQIGITTSSSVVPIETLEIRRLEPLNSTDPTIARDEVHRYRATPYANGVPLRPAEFEHRFGDGARACVALALAALGPML